MRPKDEKIPGLKSGGGTQINTDGPKSRRGVQRLSVSRLKQWEALKFGMFIHYGMSTFNGEELPNGRTPLSAYNPTKLDVEQWISIARDTGMKYAVLTTKHVAGHCLWPSRHTDYHVGNSPVKTDVVEAFLKACEKCGLEAGFYYCSWDNHNVFGSRAPNFRQLAEPSNSPYVLNHPSFVTQEYLDFQWAQINELMDRYGPIAEWWIDIPGLLPLDYRHRLYECISEKQTDSVILYNHGIGDGTELNLDYAWPTDVITIERFLPSAAHGYVPWRQIDGRWYYLPGEVCDPIGTHWFYVEDDQPRPDEELLGMYLTATSRGTNFLLDVGPDKRGLIPDHYCQALKRLRKNLDLLGF